MAPAVATEAVHVALEEKILVTVGRDGGLQGLEVLGLLTLRVAEESFGRWAGSTWTNFAL